MYLVILKRLKLFINFEVNEPDFDECINRVYIWVQQRVKRILSVPVNLRELSLGNLFDSFEFKNKLSLKFKKNKRLTQITLY